MKDEISSSQVCAVVVTYNRRSLLERAIDSLNAQSVRLGGICVVNNASTDDTQEYLDAAPNIIHVTMKTNTGGAGGFHSGIKYAVEHGFEYVWLLDDDAVATSTALEAILSAHNKLAEKYGFLCSNVISDEGDPMNVPVLDRSANATGYSDWPRYLSEGIVPVTSCTFVSCFISSSIIRELGLPLRQMFIWGDDSEFTMRISGRYRSYFIGGSGVIHKRVQKSALSILKEDNPARIRMFRNYYRNNTYNQLKYGNLISKVGFFGRCGRDALKIFISVRKNKLERLKSLVGGVLAGWKFRPRIEYPGNL